MEGPERITSLEQNILACSTALDPGPEEQQRLRRAMAHDVDGDHLISMALKEGLAGLLFRNLQKSGMLENLAEPQRQRLQSLYYQTVACNSKLIYDFGAFLEVLNQKKIPVVLLQGMSLLPQLYEDIGLRPLTDIDLWVLPEDLPGLIRILRGQGYGRDPLYPSTFRKGSTTFDLHTHILWADRIEARGLLLAKGQRESTSVPGSSTLKVARPCAWATTTRFYT